LREGPVLGDGRLPITEDIRRAVKLMRRCCAFLVFLAVVVKVRRG
jgi:cobalamin biosynthesis protein CobD/CbiB